MAEAIIVGAGPAGLAVGAVLRRANVPFVMLERSDRIGDSWHRHYERLHLHTPKSQSALPFVPYPRAYPRYPSRAQIVAYLQDYARTFALAPELGQHVVRCERQGDGWAVETTDGTRRAKHVVIATGYNRVPRAPSWPGRDTFTGTIVHSSDYASPARFRGQRVLVVGFGNSGAEIALDLCEHGVACAIAVRSAVNVIPREVLGVPITSLAIASSVLPPRVADRMNALTLRLAIGDLARYGLTKRRDGPLTQITESRQIPVIDVGTLAQLARGTLAVRPGIARFEGDEVCFVDGRRERYDAVVLATGFETGLRALFPTEPSALDDEGRPPASGGEALPGLHFCGFDLVRTGHLREIARAAVRIGDRIARAAPA